MSYSEIRSAEIEYKTLDLAKKLISIPSVSPAGVDIVDFVASYLEEHGFRCHKLVFNKTANLYAEKGSGDNNLCFAGHFDVVPAGEGWLSDPFTPLEKDGYLIGRGASDMKAAIACFIIAASYFQLKEGQKISLLISGDEEDNPQDGMISLIKWLKDKDINLNACVIGEPTAREEVGDVIKNGRRGSFTFNLLIRGIQGHVAYPQHAKNPINLMAAAVTALKDKTKDKGEACSLEFVTVNSSTHVSNLIPASVESIVNIRFNQSYNQEKLLALVKHELNLLKLDYSLQVVSYSDAFLSRNEFLQKCAKNAIAKIGKEAIVSTEGGTSDGRFLKDITNVIEIGLSNKMAHKANESVKIDEIYKLLSIYNSFINDYFSKDC